MHNDQQLVRSVDSHDAQMAVMTRLMVQRTNVLAEAIRALTQKAEIVPQLEVLDYAKTQAAFDLFNEFRKRNDHHLHMAKWFMGEDVSNLGPDIEPEPELKNEGVAEGEPQDDTFVFGGDYAGEEGRAVEQPEGGAQVNDVPQVSAADSAEDKPEDAQDAAAVP